ncbi:MAG TPA: hypothetical protein VI685_09905 [Candidatus Angelobacter sp.]
MESRHHFAIPKILIFLELRQQFPVLLPTQHCFGFDVLAVLHSVAIVAWAQGETTSAIVGEVNDISGALLPGEPPVRDSLIIRTEHKDPALQNSEILIRERPLNPNIGL